MKTTLLAILFVVLGASLASAQAVKLSNTTLNGAVTATAQTVVLTSGSASALSTVGAPVVGHVIWTADNEAMLITAINVGGSSTTFRVSRGQFGTNVASHPTSLVVVTGPPSAFQNTDAPAGVHSGGSCVLGNVGAQPWINLLNGNVGLCRSSVWKLTNYSPLTVNSITLTP